MKSRVHIVVGILLLVSSLAFAEAPKKLVIAEGANYTTSLVLAAAAPTTVTVYDCIGANPRIPVVRSEIVRNAGSLMCRAPFTLADFEGAADVVSVIRFDDGVTKSSYVLPPIGAVSVGSPVTVGPLVSDEIDGAWIAVFPEKTTPMHVTLADGRGVAEPVIEDFTAEPPVTLYRVQAKGIFSGEVAIGDSWWGCLPYRCNDLAPVFGFASTGTPDGASLRNFPFGE